MVFLTKPCHAENVYLSVKFINMDIAHNVVGWFEIPVNDLDRAVKFYETVFGFTMERQTIGSAVMAWFPYHNEGMGSPGALLHDPEFSKPSSQGTIVYFTAFSGDLSNELSRVEKAGGRVEEPKRLISPEIGYMGVFTDTEGNRVALHSRA